MKVNFKGELRRVEARDFTRKDGTTGTSYNLLVECGADSFQFPTVEEVFDAFTDKYINKGDDCEFFAEYNPKYQFNNFVVQEVVAQ